MNAPRVARKNPIGTMVLPITRCYTPYGWRPHRSLGQIAPSPQVKESRVSSATNLIAKPVLGGLHHFYQWSAWQHRWSFCAQQAACWPTVRRPAFRRVGTRHVDGPLPHIHGRSILLRWIESLGKARPTSYPYRFLRPTFALTSLPESLFILSNCSC